MYTCMCICTYVWYCLDQWYERREGRMGGRWEKGKEGGRTGRREGKEGERKGKKEGREKWKEEERVRKGREQV